ncbi:hypothetical protein HN51_024864, partial [Arachis hypogaea]
INKLLKKPKWSRPLGVPRSKFEEYFSNLIKRCVGETKKFVVSKQFSILMAQNSSKKKT